MVEGAVRYVSSLAERANLGLRVGSPAEADAFKEGTLVIQPMAGTVGRATGSEKQLALDVLLTATINEARSQQSITALADRLLAIYTPQPQTGEYQVGPDLGLSFPDPQNQATRFELTVRVNSRYSGV